LFFTPDAIRQIQRELTLLATRMRDTASIDQLYDEILTCFRVYGEASRTRVGSVRQEPWMTFLSDEEFQVCLVCSSPAFSPSFVRSFVHQGF
jgi:hypothetical protein